MVRNIGTALAVCVSLTACEVDELGGLQGITAPERDVLENKFGVLADSAPAEPSNAVADNAKAAVLGQKLFFEERYSENSQVSCATCHNPETGFQDDRANTALGLDFTGRHTPTVLNVALGREEDTDTSWQFWDGRKDSLWSQAMGPPESSVEMGGSRVGIAYMLYDLYREEYEDVFDAMPALRDDNDEPLYPTSGMPGDANWDALSAADQDMFNRIYSNFGKAIAAYERKIIRGSSDFDRFYTEVIIDGESDSDALTASAKRGLKLFIGKAGCGECHNGASFSDWGFDNTGVAQEGPHLPDVDEGRLAGVDGVVGDIFNCAGDYSDHPSKTSCGVNGLKAKSVDEGAFKTPSLRNLTETAPYMHTGTFETLEDVVAFYNDGGHESGFSGTKAEEIVPLNLTDQEQADIVAFLESLTGEELPAELMQAPTLPADKLSGHHRSGSKRPGPTTLPGVFHWFICDIRPVCGRPPARIGRFRSPEPAMGRKRRPNGTI